MSESQNPILVTRNTTVAEADLMSVVAPNRIPPDQHLDEIVASIERAPRVQTLSVVDDTGRLLGVIPFRQVVDEVFLRVFPEEFLSEIRDLRDAGEYAEKSRLSRATTAAEMMSEPVYVRPHETVAEAFHKMRSADLRGLPIVDDSMLVVGYIDLLELMMVWIRVEKRLGGQA